MSEIQRFYTPDWSVERKTFESQEALFAKFSIGEGGEHRAVCECAWQKGTGSHYLWVYSERYDSREAAQFAEAARLAGEWLQEQSTKAGSQ